MTQKPWPAPGQELVLPSGRRVVIRYMRGEDMTCTYIGHPARAANFSEGVTLTQLFAIRWCETWPGSKS